MDHLTAHNLNKQEQISKSVNQRIGRQSEQHSHQAYVVCWLTQVFDKVVIQSASPLFL